MAIRCFISADLEGATGVVGRHQLMPGQRDYPAACSALTADINAVIAGVCEAAGEPEEILVTDGHGPMRNVLLSELDERAALLSGGGGNKPLCQVQGIERGYDVACLVGFHAMAGVLRGLLAHTFVGALVHEMRLGDLPLGEVGVNARIFGHYGVPLLLVSGSAELRDEVAATVGEHVRFVATKEPVDTTAAICFPPARTHRWLQEAAAGAVKDWQEDPSRFPVTRPPEGPLRLSVTFHRREMARDAVEAPGLVRDGERGVAAEAADMPTAFARIWGGLMLAMRERPDWLV